MILRIGICEDETRHQVILENLINKQIDSKAVSIQIFDTGSALIEAYKNGVRFDILFLDVRLKEENGINVGGFIRHVDQKVKIILATSMIEYAIEGYGIGAKEFLLKPIDEQRFNQVFTKLVEEMKDTKKTRYIMEIRSEKVIIDVEDIIYIESAGRKLIVYTKDVHYEHYRSISDDEVILSELGFVKPHRSYLVNMNFIHRIKREEILLKNETRIPLTLKNRSTIYDTYAAYLMEAF